VAEKIQFITLDPDAVVASLVEKYEILTGRVLQPAQAERIVFNAIGYRLSLIEEQINETANQCMLAFATGNALDKLGELLGVVRLTSAPASCVIRFQLVSGHGDINIPSGIRVQSVDGQVVFSTIESKAVLSADTYVDIKAECIVDGVIGNDYAIGAISVILDPQPYLSSAANLDITGNGSNAETDEELRERIKLAPSAFSVAGPKGAYKYFAKSAHPNIIDVAVTTGREVSPPHTIIPGQVDIYPLMADGNPPDSQIIDAINAICNDEKVRPLTDTVVIKAPTALEYTIDVELTLLTDAVQADVEALVLARLTEYADKRKKKLGVDAVITQIIGLCHVDGVYEVNVVTPSADVEAEEYEFAKCTAITVTTTGTHDE